MSNRYENLFRSLRERGEGAFVPFLMLGDPTPEDTLDIVRTVVAAG
ncbi:tryptophan synthase subunit alpha, partial [Klebsiella pneumoniae]|nr:tryptophan synthase subunit alpha [Klebsiella pneumoniae]